MPQQHWFARVHGSRGLHVMRDACEQERAARPCTVAAVAASETDSGRASGEVRQQDPAGIVV